MPKAGGGGGEEGGGGEGGGGEGGDHDIERTHSRSLIPAVESSSHENSGDECAITLQSRGRRQKSYRTNLASPILRPNQAPTVLAHTPVQSDTSRHASPNKGTAPRLASGAPSSNTGPSSTNKGVSPKDLEERLLALLPRHEDEQGGVVLCVLCMLCVCERERGRERERELLGTCLHTTTPEILMMPCPNS